MSKVTYIISLNWNTTDLLLNLYQSLEKYTSLPYSLIIVDNGSKPQEKRKLKDFFSNKAYIIYNSQNMGIPKAYNQALNYISQKEKQPYDVVLMNSDTEIQEEKWLTKLKNFAYGKDKIGIVGFERGSGGSSPVFLDDRGDWYQRPELFEGGEGETVGFGLVFIKAPLPSLLRFDEEYGFYGHYDNDFAFKSRMLGYEVWTIALKVRHFGQRSLKINNYKINDKVQGFKALQEMRRKSQTLFVNRWKIFLAPRRKTLEEEKEHLKLMKIKFAGYRNAKNITHSTHI